jgi:transposase
MVGACELLLPVLLPCLAGARVEKVEVAADLVVITARTEAAAACPGCREASEREHSRYVRRLADLPVGGRPVRIDLSVRR